MIDTATESCKANEAGLSWNQQGPQGIQGETGPQGPPGPAGSNANVEAFADTGFVTTSVEDEVWSGFHLVLEEPVPAGSYLVTATVRGRVNGDISLPPNTTGGGVGNARFECLLRKNAPSISEPLLFRAVTPLEDGGRVVFAGQPAQFFGESSVALTGAYTATEPTTPQVQCELRAGTRTGAFAGSLSFTGNMTIIKAGSLG